jgi:hypothetical protein
MSDKKREKEEEKMVDSINVVCSIECDKCHMTESVLDYDEWLAAQHFYEKGWRKKTTKVYCKNCLITIK